MISVVIPLYNKAHTIVNTLTTVMNQTYKDFEVVIVNDGSTDNGVDVIKSNFKDSRIRIVNQENAGVSAARNRGIEKAKGDWIAFLDADDEWLPNYLSYISEAIYKSPDCSMFITARYSQNYVTRKKSTNIPAKYLNKGAAINFFENPHVYVHISATVIKTDLLFPKRDWNRFIINQQSTEDFTFLFRIALHSKVFYIGIPLSIYNGCVKQQATSTLKQEQKIKDGALFRNKVWEEWYNTHCTSKTCKIFMKYETRHYILTLIKNKEGWNYIQTFLTLLSPKYKRDIFNKGEIFLYTHRNLKRIGMYYIYLTKLIWRLHNYPRV